MPFADVNGQNLHYVDHGGEGPVIILSHGFAMGHEMWDEQIAPLAAAGWRVITHDERGWGQTTYSGAFTYWDLADDVLGLMDHLGIEQAVLGGMSQGGFLSMRAALDAPERVRALVLVDTEGGAYGDEERQQFEALFDAMMEHGFVGPVGDMLASVLFAPGFAGANIWRAKWNARPGTAWLDAKECLFERDDINDRLGEISCPSITFHGEVDAAIPLERGQAMVEMLGGDTTLVVVPGAGHSANLEKPAVVNPALVEFLNALG
ncbi:MAG: alpha/beta hydrolase [Acidimicrobiales bacterium]|nr:alpha/beta hydrolase [Acidimicrobiales bacterium]